MKKRNYTETIHSDLFKSLKQKKDQQLKQDLTTDTHPLKGKKNHLKKIKK